jgi:LCP family protein required for cell wall assembly
MRRLGAAGTHRWRRLAGAATALALLTTGCSGGGGGKVSSDDVVLGVPDDETTTSTRGPRVIVAPEPPPADLFVEGEARTGGLAEPRSGKHLGVPDGRPPLPAIEFTSAADVPPDLVFVLVIGSDARPKEDLTKTRADSVHLLAVNPATGQGTILGLPRDAWVEIPGKGRGKINSALAAGGPSLLAATVRRTTGLPVDYYLLTGFTGLTKMVDELGGVDVMVERRMSDKASGAFFERGWHRFSGTEALAFSRNRNDVANGDFSRSGNHGVLMLAALAKMRGEVGDDDGLGRWIDVMLRHVRLDVPLSSLRGLAALARNLDPARMTNVVAPGRIGKAGGQSVVFLTKGAVTLFDDLRADGVVGGATAPVAPAAKASSSTPSSSPSEDPTGSEEQSTTTAPPAAEETTTTTGPEAVPTPIPLPGRAPSTTTTVPGDPPDEDEDEGEDTTSTTSEPTLTPSPGKSQDEDDNETADATTTTTVPDEDEDEGDEADAGDDPGGSSGGGSRRGRRG